ncbi:MAG: hypothetical protein A3E82_04495 [Gammaproteobacteria bacterium RIFCSPHIGHO2_12_FULL_38_11]|nr:MAG: hypothetical protein A3E82_04495 [Gammaproteobacteria bacterium RIFCSPHIGHO2_12_FULL_38_11]
MRFVTTAIALFLLLPSFAFAQGKVLPEVKLTINTQISGPTDGVSFFGGNPNMFDPNAPFTGGLLPNDSIWTFLHGVNDGPSLQDQLVSETVVDIFYGNWSEESTFCELKLDLNSDTSKLISAEFIKNIPYTPGSKPITCSLQTAGQNVTLTIAN